MLEQVSADLHKETKSARLWREYAWTEVNEKQVE